MRTRDPYLVDAAARFSGWLQSALNERGLKQADLVRLMGSSTGVVSKWCNGTSLPEPLNAKKLAEVLGTDVEFVFDLISPHERSSGYNKTSDMDHEVWYFAVTFQSLPKSYQRLVKHQIRAIHKAADEEKART